MKALSVFVSPGDGAPYLFRHRHQAAAQILHKREIGNDGGRSSLNEWLR